MKTVKQFITEKSSIIFGLAIFAGLIWLLYIIVTKFLNWLSILENQIAAAVVTVSATALISIGCLILSKQYEHKRDIRKEHNSKKVPVYEELISFMFKVFFAQKAGEKPPSEQEIIKFFAESTPKLVVWGDESVIKSFCLLRDKSVNIDSGKSAPVTMFLFENLLLAMRKDLGHKDKKIQKGDLLILFITDIKKYL